MASVGEITNAIPSEATDATPTAGLPAERTNASEDLDPVIRHDEDSREHEPLLAVSASAVM